MNDEENPSSGIDMTSVFDMLKDVKVPHPVHPFIAQLTRVEEFTDEDHDLFFSDDGFDAVILWAPEEEGQLPSFCVVHLDTTMMGLGIGSFLKVKDERTAQLVKWVTERVSALPEMSAPVPHDGGDISRIMGDHE